MIKPPRNSKIKKNISFARKLIFLYPFFFLRSEVASCLRYAQPYATGKAPSGGFSGKSRATRGSPKCPIPTA